MIVVVNGIVGRTEDVVEKVTNEEEEVISAGRL